MTKTAKTGIYRCVNENARELLKSSISNFCVFVKSKQTFDCSQKYLVYSVFSFNWNRLKRTVIRWHSTICNICQTIRWTITKVILNYSPLPTVSHFHPSVIFVGKTGACPNGPHSKTLTTNIKLGDWWRQRLDLQACIFQGSGCYLNT